MKHNHPARAWLAQNGLEALWDAAHPWYKKPKRAYHNIKHAHYVASALFDLVPAPRPALLLAAIWHDAIYIPGAENKVNELASSQLLLVEARNIGFSKGFFEDANEDALAIIETAANYIRRTDIKTHLGGKQHGDLAVLLDADLAAMGTSSFSQFVKNQKNILIENAGQFSEEGLEQCYYFLSNFKQNRAFIYHTDKGRELYEANAVENIRRLGVLYATSTY